MPQPLTVLRALEAASHQPMEPSIAPTVSQPSTLVPLAMVFAQRKPCLSPTAAGTSKSGGEVTSNDGSSTYDPIDDD
jgi:hypothetical protein